MMKSVRVAALVGSISLLVITIVSHSQVAGETTVLMLTMLLAGLGGLIGVAIDGFLLCLRGNPFASRDGKLSLFLDLGTLCAFLAITWLASQWFLRGVTR
jgi:hypothetical protein